MYFLKEAAKLVLTGLITFVLFLLLFEERMAVPSILKLAGRLHPLILHFPIVILLIAFVLQTIKRHLPIDESATNWFVRALLLVGSLSAGFTVAFGIFLSKEEGYDGDLLFWHKWTGIGVFVCAALLWTFYEKLGKNVLLASMWATAAVLVSTGHFGASMTHGEGFITETIFTGSKNRPDLSNPNVYADLVVPILKEKCFSCHNPDKAKGGLILTDTISLAKGGESGILWVGGKSGESLLTERLLLDIEHEHRMPPKGKPQLSPSEIGLIRAWIDAGGDFNSTLEALPQRDDILKLATTIYGSDDKKTYQFPAAATDLIRQLNTSYRLVAPVAYGSPALDVSFFGRYAFDPNSLRELDQISKQIVSLNLAGMPVGDADLSVISAFSNLEKLNLSQTQISENGLAALQKLEELHTLQLSGTNLSGESLKDLTALPKLKQLFVWNTGITQHDISALPANRRGIRIEIGRTSADSTLLQLNKLAIFPENSFFREPFHLELKHPVSSTKIYYTLDGSEPDTLSSPTFGEPIRIEQNTIVKARPTKEGWIPGDVIEKSFLRTTFAPGEVTLVTLPNPYHKGKGGTTLFDLEAGSTDILYASDGKWLGYKGGDFVVDLKFSAPTEMTEITLSTLTSVALQAFPPQEITISEIGSSGLETVLIRVKPTPASKESKISRNLIQCHLPAARAVRQLRISATPLQQLPAWNGLAGQPAWFFIDEILLK